MFFGSNKEESQIDVSVNNQTILLLWLPKKNGEVTTVADVLAAIQEARKQQRHVDVNVGHVAMCTPNRYVSLWPAESAGGHQFKVVNARYTNLPQDIFAEGGKPDVLVRLYSLDTKAIENAFDDIQQTSDGFVLAGDKSITRLSNDRKGRNCNGLVYELLQCGGVDRITPYGGTSEFSIYISPDKFNTYIQAVKAEELEQYPMTKEFPLLENEYQPVVKNPGPWCTIL